MTFKPLFKKNNQKTNVTEKNPIILLIENSLIV